MAEEKRKNPIEVLKEEKCDTKGIKTTLCLETTKKINYPIFLINILISYCERFYVKDYSLFNPSERDVMIVGMLQYLTKLHYYIVFVLLQAVDYYAKEDEEESGLFNQKNREIEKSYQYIWNKIRKIPEISENKLLTKFLEDIHTNIPSGS